MTNIYIYIYIYSYYMIYVYSVTCIYTQKGSKRRIYPPSVQGQLWAPSNPETYGPAATGLVPLGSCIVAISMKPWDFESLPWPADHPFSLSSQKGSAELIRGSADPGKAVPKWQYQLLSLKAFEGVGCGAWLPKKELDLENHATVYT